VKTKNNISVVLAGSFLEYEHQVKKGRALNCEVYMGFPLLVPTLAELCRCSDKNRNLLTHFLETPLSSTTQPPDMVDELPMKSKPTRSIARNP
jgi:hypothetical protein